MFNKYGELRSGWSLALAFIVFSVAQGIVFTLYLMFLLVSSADSYLSISPMDLALEVPLWVQALGFTLSFVGLLALFKLIYKRPLSEMGFGQQKAVKNFVLGCVFGVAAISLIFVLMLATGQITAEFLGISQASIGGIALSLVLHLTVGFTEEALSRGYFMTALKTTRNTVVIVLVPILFFSLMHVPNPGFNLLAFINICLVGLVFALMFIRTGSLWMPIAFHFVWNFVQGSVYGLSVSGMQIDSLVSTSFIGADWLTGGVFGPEASVITTIVLLAVLGATYLFVKTPENRAWTLTNNLPLVRGGINNASYPPPQGVPYRMD